jgi:hypothetical protein
MRLKIMDLLGADPGQLGGSLYAAAARAENLEGLPSASMKQVHLVFPEEDMEMEYARRLNARRRLGRASRTPGCFHALSCLARG